MGRFYGGDQMPIWSKETEVCVREREREVSFGGRSGSQSRIQL